jgi:hypothetical protein
MHIFPAIPSWRSLDPFGACSESSGDSRRAAQASEDRSSPLRGSDSALRFQQLRRSDQSSFKKELLGNSLEGDCPRSAPISTVRHSDSPQTEQQRVLPTLAPSHCSMGLPPIQMRLDSEGLALNDASSMSLISRTGSMPRGRSASLSLLMACCIS